MRFNIGSSSRSSFAAPADAQNSSLPTDHPPVPSSSRSPPPSCPMHAPEAPTKPAASVVAAMEGAQCPIPHESRMNPLNIIPMDLSATQKQPNQTLDLPTDRTASTIPRPKTEDEEGEVWDYPSPQQFYNALVRKGYDTPEDSVEMMVHIHNFLNERAWQEVMQWEKRKPGGEFAQLARFQGRPGELTPKARMMLWAGWLFPSRFNTDPPFDRHDWMVTRPDLPAQSQTTTQTTVTPNSRQTTTITKTPEGTSTITTRYVIDYYSGPPDEEGNPVFYLDVRPALDNFESISQRIRVGLEEFMKKQKDE